MTDHEPAFPISVPGQIYAAVVNAAGGPFADSYLFGADVYDGRLTPRTLTAWERLRDTPAVMDALDKAGLRLIKPPPFSGIPAAEILGLTAPKRRAA